MRWMWRGFVGVACLLAASAALGAAATSTALRVEEPRVGEDGRVRLRWTGRQEIVVARDRGGNCDGAVPKCEDAGASHLSVSSNRRSVGWTAEYNGCCQSYPIPYVLVIARDGRVVHRLGGVRGIYDWRFEKDDALVAIFTDTSHSNLTPECELYDTRTWKILDEWHRGKSTELPEWAQPFAESVGPTVSPSGL